MNNTYYPKRIYKKFIALFSIYAGIILFSCCSNSPSDFSDQEHRYLISPIRVDSVRLESINGKRLIFTVFCTINDPCWEFTEAPYRIKNDNNIYVSIKARRDKETICVQVISELTQKITLTALQSGQQTIYFWQGEDAYLTIPLTIP
jgi:hypothetical protein